MSKTTPAQTPLKLCRCCNSKERKLDCPDAHELCRECSDSYRGDRCRSWPEHSEHCECRRATPDLSAMGGETAGIVEILNAIADEIEPPGTPFVDGIRGVTVMQLPEVLRRTCAALTAQSAALAEAQEKLTLHEAETDRQLKINLSHIAYRAIEGAAYDSAKSALLAIGCRLGDKGWERPCSGRDNYTLEGCGEDGEEGKIYNRKSGGFTKCPRCHGTGWLPIVASPSNPADKGETG